jgi:hypothetical protein
VVPVIDITNGTVGRFFTRKSLLQSEVVPECPMIDSSDQTKLAADAATVAESVGEVNALDPFKIFAETVALVKVPVIFAFNTYVFEPTTS